MSNEKLIKALRCKTNNVNDCTMCDYHNACYDGTLASIAAKVLEEADKRIEKLEKHFPKEGEWIIKPHGTYGQLRAFCSACGKHSGIGGIVSNQKKPYCPNCGARMRGGNDEE